MERGAWKRPVVLEIYGRPGQVTVSDTLEAAKLLLDRWSGKQAPSHLTAVKTCRDVLSGRASPGFARAVFIDAALDAGYWVRPETFLDDIQFDTEASSAASSSRTSPPSDIAGSSDKAHGFRVRSPQIQRISKMLQTYQMSGQLLDILSPLAASFRRRASTMLGSGRARIAKPT